MFHAKNVHSVVKSLLMAPQCKKSKSIISKLKSMLPEITVIDFQNAA